jgi:hypothetical protein
VYKQAKTINYRLQDSLIYLSCFRYLTDVNENHYCADKSIPIALETSTGKRPPPHTHRGHMTNFTYTYIRMWHWGVGGGDLTLNLQIHREATKRGQLSRSRCWPLCSFEITILMQNSKTPYAAAAAAAGRVVSVIYWWCSGGVGVWVGVLAIVLFPPRVHSSSVIYRI